MKLLYYSPDPALALNSLSGYGTHMREMISAFKADGHEIKVVIMGGLEDNYDSRNTPSFSRRVTQTIKRLVPSLIWATLKDWSRVRTDRRFELELESIVLDWQPDVIYERASYLQPSGINVAKKSGVRHVLEVNAPYVDINASSTLFRKKAIEVEYSQLSTSNRVLCVSRTLKNYLIKKHKLDSSTFFVTYQAVDPNKAIWSPERVEEIRSKYNVASTSVIGFVGALFNWHKLDLLVHATSELALEGYDVTLLIVGDGSAAPGLRELANKLLIADRIIFTGRVPFGDIFNFIQLMDIAVQPGAEWYQSPTKLFEYGILGKPIIAPNIPAVSEVIEPDVDAVLVKPDVDDLIDALKRLLDNREYGSLLGKSFKKKVLDKHTWRNNVLTALK